MMKYETLRKLFYDSFRIKPIEKPYQEISSPYILDYTYYPGAQEQIDKRVSDWNNHRVKISPIVIGEPIKKKYKGYSAVGQNHKRDYVYNKLKSLGASDDVAIGLTIQAGAEAGYDPKATNKWSKAAGLGGWLGTAVLSKVLNYINGKYNTHYTTIQSIPLDHLIDALKWFYYDKNKELADTKEDKGLFFSKYGFSPAITRTGKYKHYTDTPEGWTAYMNDTGNNPDHKWNTFEDMYLKRVENAGFEYNK